MNCFVDDTSFGYNNINLQNIRTPNIHLLGGIIISKSEEIKLIELIKSVKSKYTHPNLPIKWNMRDTTINEIYNRFNRQGDYEKLLRESMNWRREIFANSLDINYLIIISCIENYQIGNENQRPIRDNISAYLFANLLMRIALHVKNFDIKNIQVVMDWPPGNNPKPFNDEYYYAFNGGISTSRIKYYAGKLNDLDFNEAIHFAKCTHSTMLQFCDMIIGAFKDSFEAQLKKEANSAGKEISEIVLSKLDGYPKKIKSRGINVSAQNIIFKSLINNIIESFNIP